MLFEDAQREGMDLTTAWQPNGNVVEGLGTRLVNTIETFRLESFSQPTALRSIAAVLAIITKRQDNQQYCLMQFDEKANQFQPLGGKREADDPTLEAALLRELAEELNLPPLASDSCQLVPLVLNKSYQQVSATLQVITQYEHSFYHVRAIRFPLVVDELTRWISLNEIHAGVTHDGRKISPLVLSLSLETLEGLSASL
jgi:8-oxo-dGTP pyrophosphatase MutT (NUDIX family)